MSAAADPPPDSTGHSSAAVAAPRPADAPRSAEPLQRVLADLAARPWAFDFRQALRLLEAANLDRPRLGTASRASLEPVRLRQRPYLSFAPADLQEYVPGEGDQPAHLAAYVFGLHGPNSPIPRHLTEYQIDRGQKRDTTLAAFLDIFHHRLLSMFYRAGAEVEPTSEHDRPADDRLARLVSSLAGLREPACTDRDAMPDRLKLHFVGRLSMAARSADGLATIVASYLGVGVQIDECVPGWLPVAESAQLRAGGSVLGQSSVLGRRVWSASHQFRLRLGPLDYLEFQSLLPNGTGWPKLVAMVRNYCGLEFDWEVQLQLRRAARPPFRLSAAQPPRLGWTSWLGDAAPATDDTQVVVRPRL